MENKVPLLHYLVFHSKEFPETPHLSLQLYCLETISVWLASASNEWQVFYVTYIQERGTELRCYSFVFTSIRLQACCVIHFYSCSFSMHDLRFKCACGYFISHIFIWDHWLCNTFSTHWTIYCFLEAHMSGSHETLFCWIFLLFLHQFISHFITDLELQLGSAPPPRNDTIIGTCSGLLTCCRDLINIVHKQVWQSTCVLVFYLFYIHIYIRIFVHVNVTMFFLNIRICNTKCEDSTVTIPNCWR